MPNNEYTLMYIVEHKTLKGWETSQETRSIGDANKEFLTIIVDGYEARITAVKEQQ